MYPQYQIFQGFVEKKNIFENKKNDLKTRIFKRQNVFR